MTINVSPTAVDPSHHLKLTDSSSTELGLICADAQGNRVSRVGVNPYPTMASQLRQGRGKHADRVPPFEDIPLSDFSGGMAMLHHDEDASKYLEGYRMDTSQAGRMMLGGRERYTKGIRDFNESVPSGSIRSDFASLFTGGATSVQSATFTVSAINGTSYAGDKAIVWLKKVGSPTGNVTLTLIKDPDGTPSTEQTVTYAAASCSVAAPYAVEFDWTGTETMADADAGWAIKVAYSAGDTSNYIGVHGFSATSTPYYRVLDNTGAYNMLFFEYRGGFYGITQPEDRGNSSLYILGTRALADANTGNLDRLADSDKNFSSAGYDVQVGDLVKIVAGPGSEEDQPWRSVTAAYDNYVEVSPDWVIEHTVNTEYVIITDTWELLDVNDTGTDFGAYVTDVAVTDRVIHIAMGQDDEHHRLRYGNNDGTWTFEGEVGGTTEAQELWEASKFLPVRIDRNVPERETYFDLWVARNHQYSSTSTDTVYPNNIMKLAVPPYWDSPYFYLGQLTDNLPWIKNEYTNVDSYADRRWAAIEWNATFTTGSIAAKALDPPVDMSEAELILFSMSTDTELAANDLTLTLGDGDDTLVLNFPQIFAEDDMNSSRRWYEIPLHAAASPPSGSDFPDLTKIDRVLIKVAVDKNAIVKIKLGKDGMLLASRDALEKYSLDFGERINNMVEYGGGAGQVSRKPWVGTNKNLYYVESGQLKPIYLRELEELEHYRNCEGMCVNDVYLYFNQGEKIQRYYAGHLDNVGPDAEYGLPEARRGIPCSMASYPGKVLSCVDAGTSGTSTVMYRKNHGWHEFYRAPLAGERIKRIHVLGRDDITDQVFISEGSDVLWVPISVNPEYDSDYEHTNFGEIVTSRVYGGLRETEKYYHALTTIQEEHIQGGEYAEIYIDYRTSESPTTWVAISDDFATVPRERNSLVSTNDVKGRWIQFRVRFETEINEYSPILVSLVLDAVERLDVNNTYSYTVELKEGTTNDLAGYQETQTGVAKLTQLETWVDSPLPLTLNTCSAFEDDKLVFLEGVRKRVLYHTVDDKEQEVRLADLTLIEVE